MALKGVLPVTDNRGTGKRPSRLVWITWLLSILLVLFGLWLSNQDVSIPISDGNRASCGTAWTPDVSAAKDWGRTSEADMRALIRKEKLDIRVPDFERLAEIDCNSALDKNSINSVSLVGGGLALFGVGGLIWWAGVVKAKSLRTREESDRGITHSTPTIGP